MTNSKEAKARIKINKLLEKADWRFFDDVNSKANISLELNIKLNPKVFNELGDDFENRDSGFVDYLLYDSKDFPLCVLEAKRTSLDPLFAKEQARKYANSLNVRFVILSNGDIHYLWDTESGNPQVISKIPTQESLEERTKFKKQTQNLLSENVIPEYIALTKNPNLLQEPDYLDAKKKDEYCFNNGYKILRPYQIDAIKTIQKSVQNGQDRFLLEMATGLGKTLTAAALIQLFLKTGNATRVLFLVDRLELETQAHSNFKDYLKDFTSVIYKKNKDDWRKAEVVITTIQSLLFNNKYKNLFSPTDFDLLISDEAHRSISGNSRAVFEYFIGYKLGLTATPKDYLKNINKTKLSENDPKSLERRLLLSTYETFGCSSGEPTFRYSLIDGVNGGYLVNPFVIDARTQITTQLLSDNGYSVQTFDDTGNEISEQVFQTDFERKFFNDKTNITFCKTFMENALSDPISNEIGKTLIFCVSQKHCAKIVQILNEFATKMYPQKYNSDFAVQVTSSVADAQDMTKQFANNKLNGKSIFKEGYDTSKTRVCVTYGMMTTGYDCSDILNLVLMRPIFSPTDFVQMKGRGTRKHTFRFTDIDGQEIKVEKTHYKMFDFFAVCEYFEEKFNYNEKLPLPSLESSDNDSNDNPQRIEKIVIDQFDPAQTVEVKTVGVEGMRVDREFWQKARKTIRDDNEIIIAIENQDWDSAIKIVKEKYENKPELFITLEKIRKAVNLDRRLSWREILEFIFDSIDNFKKRDELIEEECDKFISIYKPEYHYIPLIRDYIDAYLTDGEFRNIIEKKEYASLAVYPGFPLNNFIHLNGYRDILPVYIKENIPINTYL
jgi:type I restriction enzyme R subunit